MTRNTFRKRVAAKLKAAGLMAAERKAAVADATRVWDMTPPPLRDGMAELILKPRGERPGQVCSGEARHSFCESVTASPVSPWHIRRLTESGPKPGGGADTDALCGRKVCWDIQVEITDHHLGHCCQECAVLYRMRSMTAVKKTAVKKTAVKKTAVKKTVVAKKTAVAKKTVAKKKTVATTGDGDVTVALLTVYGADEIVGSRKAAWRLAGWLREVAASIEADCADGTPYGTRFTWRLREKLVSVQPATVSRRRVLRLGDGLDAPPLR